MAKYYLSVQNVRETMMERMKKLRQNGGLTQEAIAERLGVHRTVYSRIESGKQDPSFEFLVLLSNYYNTQISYFVGDKGTM